MASSERRRRAAGLDGLRGLAALAGLMMHVWLYRTGSRPERDGFWDFVAFELRLALVAFFVLSGYLLYRDFARAALRREETVDLVGYAKRRLARILPAYYVAMIGTFLMLWGAGDTPGVRLPDASEVPLFAIFGQNYSDGTIMRANPVTWTLCLEAAFYTLLPLLGLAAYRLTRGRVRRQAVLIAAMLPLGIGWNAVVWQSEWGSIAIKALPAYLPYFAFGMLLALWHERRLVAHGEHPRFGPGATAAIVAGGFGLVALNGYWHATTLRPGEDLMIGLFRDLPAGVGFAAVIAAAIAGCGPGVAWLRVKQLAQVGIVSYGFYLWHVPLILFLRRYDLFPEGFFTALALILPPALALGFASWHLVEKPLMKRAARSARARRPARARAALEARAAP